ncbi:hypothetical protein FHR95_002831 [Halomonas fontilapidosi]|uniref:Uncharacterized protein n=1 Tax=Halomonas fontilapidosi TaxID=616675 RepID=A0A7W5DMC2_9GAMM|nr:hypothetical protein [Halomonas fontilapidosi]MBB3185250.1 hypothetical protein [Halomonas fontilapidosi]
MFKKAWQRNCKKAGLTALLAVSTTGLAAPAEAATSDFDAFTSSRELSDAELGQQRGRFVDKGSLMFFGVQVTSEWRTSHGEHLVAQGDLRGDLSGATPRVSFQPRITAVAADSLASDGLAGNGATVVDAGTGNAGGVVQTIQAAGDFNAAANDLQIDVLDAADASAPQGGGAASGSAVEQRLASGTRVSVSNGPQGMGVSLDVPGMGRVKQAVVPSQGLRQSIQLSSDFQQVRNLTRLQLYMGERGAKADAPGVRRAVRSARPLAP